MYIHTPIQYLELMPHNCTAWKAFAQLETNVGETLRARAIYELAVSQGALDMPELLWFVSAVAFITIVVLVLLFILLLLLVLFISFLQQLLLLLPFFLIIFFHCSSSSSIIRFSCHFNLQRFYNTH